MKNIKVLICRHPWWKFSLSGRPTRKLVFLLMLLIVPPAVFAQISIEGLEDKEVYTGVSFKVVTEPGFDYSALLNGTEIETGISIEVNNPDYYLLSVSRRNQSSGAEENKSIQFIIRAAERGNSEWGLPAWTPYPPIDSASAEFNGSVLKIIAPYQYPTGLDIPVIARVESNTRKRLGVNGPVTAPGFENYPLQLMRGVGSVFLPGSLNPGIYNYHANIKTVSKTLQLEVESSTSWQTVKSDITSSTIWPENSRIHITNVNENLLTIASGTVLTIGMGSVIVVDPDIEIAVEGSIIVNGTEHRPVVFTAPDRNICWGGFLFETADSLGDFTGTIFTASGADPDWFTNNSGHGSSHRKDQCLFYLSNGSDVSLTNCYMIENKGQMGHGEGSKLTMTGCLVQKCQTVGQYNGGSVAFNNCELIEFPDTDNPFVDADNDCIYLTSGTHTFTNCLIGWSPDDGIDAGGSGAGTVEVTGCWFEGFFHEGMALSGPKNIEIDSSVFINCGQGIECGYDAPNVNAVRCLCTNNLVGARYGDCYDWSYGGYLTVKDSLLLFNMRDAWGRSWDDWEYHVSQMDITGNYLSKPNSFHPDNIAWNPQSDPNQTDNLLPLLASTGETAGLGIAMKHDLYDLSELPSEVPVSLSTFCKNQISVDYTVYTRNGLHDNGTLVFIPGQVLKHIHLTFDSTENLHTVKVTLSNPVNAEINSCRQVTWQKPYESVYKLIAEGDQWKYFKGTTQPPADWNLNTLGYPREGWFLGSTPIGYETGSGLETCLAAVLEDMHDNYLSVYTCRVFSIDDPAMLTGLTLDIKFDDGYIAYLNGTEVSSRYPPDPVAYDEPASTDNHEAYCDQPGDTVDLTAYIPGLSAGDNILAVQVHNTSTGSSDFFFSAELSCVTEPYPGDFEPDGDIDLVDLAELSASWSARYGQPGYNPVFDINTPADGEIDILDLLVFAENWLIGIH